MIRLESWHAVTDVLRRHHRRVSQRAGEEAAGKWTEGDESNSQLAAGVEDRHFGVARPQRVLGLDSGERMHAVGLADRGRRHLAQANGPDLALPDQIGERADAVFDRHALVPAMEVIDVDHLRLQTREAFLAVT